MTLLRIDQRSHREQWKLQQHRWRKEKTLAEGAKKLANKGADTAQSATDESLRYAKKVAYSPVANAARDALLGDVNEAI